MTRYLVLLRGINVGGKNKIPMAELRAALEKNGFSNVSTYIASGNVLLSSNDSSERIAQHIEALLTKHFTLDSTRIMVHVITPEQLRQIISNKPKGFGEQPTIYHSDVIFLMGITAANAIKVFNPREGIDTVTPGNGVIYSQRLSAERTKSRLSAIVSTPAYANMTIRSWNTVSKLCNLVSFY